MRALDRKLWRELWSMRVQLLAIVAVVACGIASYVAMLSAHASLSRSRAVYYASSRFGDVWATVSRAPVALERRIAEIPGVARVETRIVESLTLDVPGLPEPATGRIVSIEGRPRERLNDLHLRRGRWPEPGRAGEVLVSEPFANIHALVPGDSLAAVMGGRRETLEIVGIALSPEYVFAMPAGAPWPDDRRFGVLWMDEDSLAAAYGMQGAFNDVVLELGAGASEREVVARLDDLLAPWGGFGAHGRERQASHRFLSEELEQLESMGTVVPMIFLAVAAFLLNVVLSRIVGGQRELIAALKALGYGNARLGLHYAEMVLVVVGLGSALGVGLGAWLGSAMVELYRQFFRFPTLGFSLRLDTILAAVGVSTLAGVLGALASVRRAVSLPPAEGMRPPAPPLYRRGIAGSAALARLLSQPARIVVRNLGRHPGRALLSSLGVALSIAIMIAGSFSQDALDYVMDVSFQRQQRHDVQVAFRQPIAPEVLHDLAHLPGVLSVEAERVVPVRLRAETARYETAIAGMPDQPQLKRLVDRDLRPIEIPPSGLMLTDELARRLRVGIGDRVDVEVLEGARRVREVEVTGTSTEMLGLSGYMRFEPLRRLLGEGPRVSGALLVVDPPQREALYLQLKSMPAVAGVGLRTAAYDIFNETTAELQTTTTLILSLFASVIAVGVVYNGARIVLAERARELATLRVIGFTRAEVSTILLGELGVQLLIAIPLGWALGWLLAFGVVAGVDAELYRFPLIIAPRTLAFATGVVLFASMLAALAVRRKIDHLDLVEVLKTRE